MNKRFVISMGISIVGLVVGFVLLYDIQQSQESQITQNSLDQALQNSNNRLSIVTEDFYNGKYNGDIPKEEVIKIIKGEIDFQKKLLEQYNSLPIEEKTDRTIDMRFFQLGKYSWASEESMLRMVESDS